MSATEKITQKQELAITALLATGDQGRAAKASGVNPSTLRRWFNGDTAFVAAYAKARREAFSLAVAALQRLAAKAVACLESVLDDPDAPPQCRVGAARTVLELAVKGTETQDIIARIDALEEASADAPRTH